MSHGHSHGGDDHGHSHAGGSCSSGHGQKRGPVGEPDQKLNEMYDDDEAPRIPQQQAVMDPQTLEEAAEQGALSAAIMAVARGSLVNRTDAGVGATPLHWAAFKGHIAVVRFLLDQGADVNRTDSRSQTPLMWAITEHRLEVVDFLMDHGADPFVPDARGCDAYSMACQHGSLAMLHLLHTHKPLNPASVDKDQHNLLVWACYKGHIAVAEYLHKVHKVPHQQLDNSRRNALHWAAREGHDDICVWLLGLGLSATQPDADGMTPTAWAAKHNHYTTKLLLEKNVSTPVNKVTGTISTVAGNLWLLGSVLVAVLYYIFGFALIARWIPSAVAYSVLGSYAMKNTLVKGLWQTPMRNSRPEPSLAEMVGAPKTVTESFRGPEFFRWRDPGNIALWIGLIITQHVAMHVCDVEVNPVLDYGLLATIALAVFISKQSSFEGIVPAGTVAEDPVLRAVEKKEFEDCRWQRIYRTSHHIRVPLRAFHCKEMDVVMQEYDGWSLMLDMPVTSANRRSFVIFLIALAVHQVFIAVSAWQTFSHRYCNANDEFAVTSLVWNLFFSSMPCKMPNPDNSWWYFFIPQSDNRCAMYLIIGAVILALIPLGTLAKEFAAIHHGLSTIEVIHLTMPSTDGGLTPIVRNGHSVFSAGSAVRNFVAFFAGTAGRQWRTATAIPPPQSVRGLKRL
jgi:hypothetical protein